MKHIFTISLCFLALSLSAQETITYPYNPDGDADGLVAVPDLQDILAVYGNPFSPAEIMVGDTALSEWIQILYQALEDQQEVIEAMQGAGRCDFSFPEGIHGEPVIYDMSTGDYTVPDDKSLYIINLYTNNCALSVEDIIIHNAQSNTSYPNTKSFSLNQPIIVGSGEVVSANDQPGFINGLLIDKQVNPITHQLFNDETFEVPLGKTLYITHLFSGGQPNLLSFLIDNNIIFSNDANHSNGESIQRPIIINSGRVLSLQTDNSGIGYAFNGYLVDEDYFADCGGGGSSEGGLGLAFGKRVNLEESEDGGPIPWNSDKNYGVYDFESDGLVFFSNPDETNLLILNDSIEMLELMTPEVFYEFSVGELDPGTTITIPVRKDEKLVIEGSPFMFNLQGHLFQWIPLESEPVGISAESELDVFYATNFEVNEWNNFLPLQIDGKPDVVLISYPSEGQGTLPVIAPDPSGYNVFDEVVFMMSESPISGEFPQLINIELYYTPMNNGDLQYYLFNGDRSVSIILGPDGYWRVKN